MSNCLSVALDKCYNAVIKFVGSIVNSMVWVHIYRPSGTWAKYLTSSEKWNLIVPTFWIVMSFKWITTGKVLCA